MKAGYETVEARCSSCNKKVDSDKLNDFDICPSCVRKEAKKQSKHRRNDSCDCDDFDR